MSSLRLATAANVRAFEELFAALDTHDSKWAASIDREALEDESGRFRVWAANLGALQLGHSCLDYRLRDSPLLSSNALKFLNELEDNLNESLAVITGQRLPYEEQPKPEKTDEDDDSDFFSEEEDEEEDDPSSPKTELYMRLGIDVVDIIDNLYKLSVRIRTPTIRSRSLKAASFHPKDSETGVDVLAQYSGFDILYIKELLNHLRQPHDVSTEGEDDYLSRRLSAAITLRRRQFKYWRRHRDKLAASAFSVQAPTQTQQPPIVIPEKLLVDAPLEVPQDERVAPTLKNAPSHKTGKTLLSGTEATQHHKSLDDIIDNKSVTSYAVTVKDIQGRGVDLPPPPKAAGNGKDFECTYCYIICPARYGRGRAWRTHLLQDLQPYICTYEDCDGGEQLFRSRREWAEHEATHRKVWRCPEHMDAVYKSPSGLEGHFKQEHKDSFPESQLATIVKAGETSTEDDREMCPICHASTNTEGLGDFQNHIANHLERIATFALPRATDDDSDGDSGVASRGWSGSSGSQDVSEMSLPSEESNEPEESKAGPSGSDPAADSSELVDVEPRMLLSTESLQHIPDTSQNRHELVIKQLAVDKDDEPDNAAQPPDEDIYEDLDEIEEHLRGREEFRIYMSTELNAQSVRFYRGYGAWKGSAEFEDQLSATKALKIFNAGRFPDVKLQQSPAHANKLKFATSVVVKDQKPWISRQSTGDTQESEDDGSIASGYTIHGVQEAVASKGAVLTVDEIPTLQSLYRSQKLLQRDQSYGPNDKYNRLIAFCRYDITRLQVDAIVNSANASMRISENDSLNNAIHRGGGPELTKEAKSQGKVKAGQVALTHGHNLPAKWVIHASRPQYFASKGMGKFNLLTECYRSALKMADNHELKTLAFPCLGTGGCGFPPRVAARIALQEVREFLDGHPELKFERIIFCVNTAIDEKAYLDFLAVFFPPTHGDLDIARSSDWSANRAAMAAQALETRAQIQQVLEELVTEFGTFIPKLQDDILTELHAIDSALAEIRDHLLGPKEIIRSLGDLNLICSVMQTICGSVSEMIELARDTSRSTSSHKSIWDDFNSDMTTRHGRNLGRFLVDCQNFVRCLADIITLDGRELDEMSEMRQRLELYGVKVGQSAGGIRDHLDEVLYTREFQRENIVRSRDTVKLHQIPSLARLYQDNELEAKPTLAKPSAIFNHAVCLIREDITKVEVDLMVNSTDMEFTGMGTLDRSVFMKGGAEMQSQIKLFGRCKEGEVRLTPGYLLPAKHILHVIPPEMFRGNTKDVLRQIYREALDFAVAMKATSIAIPCIGTGMLNYPRRDCASLAIEEVKRFLETADPRYLIEKIVFVVFSSNDEFIYKSLLPTFFPPKDYSDRRLSSTVPTEQTTRISPGVSSSSLEAPKRTIFKTISDAFRGVRFGSQSETSRQSTTYEEHALINFERHALDCAICKDINKLYLDGRDLCEVGYPLAQQILWYMTMQKDQKILSKPDRAGNQERIEVPSDLFPLSIQLLHTVEKSFRDEGRPEPFVSMNRRGIVTSSENQAVKVADITTRTGSTIPIYSGRERPRAEVSVWSDLAQKWEPISSELCSIHVHEGRVDVRASDYHTADQMPWLSLRLDAAIVIEQHETPTHIRISGAQRLESALKTTGDLLFRSENAVSSRALLESLQGAVVTEPTQPVPSKTTIQSRSSLSKLDLPQGIEAAAGSRRLPSQDGQVWSNMGPEASLSALASEVLEHLITDWQTRPGSYIGQKTGDIAMALALTEAQLQPALAELSEQRKIHNTLDDRTWVVSHTPRTLPVVEYPDTHSHSVTNDKEEDLQASAQKVLDYMRYADRLPEDRKGRTVREIASALQVHTTRIWPALRDLAAKGEIWRPSEEVDWWLLAEKPSESSTQDALHSDKIVVVADPSPVVIKPATTFNEPLPSPTSSEKRFSTAEPGDELANIDEYFSYPTPFGARWTRIDKRLVSPAVLIDQNEDFEDVGDALIVHRVLRRGEIRRWAERTKEITDWDNSTRAKREWRARRRSWGSRGETRAEGKGKEKAEGPRSDDEDEEAKARKRGAGEKDRKLAELEREVAQGEDEERRAGVGVEPQNTAEDA